jgi:hypothetical protein
VVVGNIAEALVTAHGEEGSDVSGVRLLGQWWRAPGSTGHVLQLL